MQCISTGDAAVLHKATDFQIHFVYVCKTCCILTEISLKFVHKNLIKLSKDNVAYHQSSNISLTLEGNQIVDHSDVVGASPVGAAPTTSSFST